MPIRNLDKIFHPQRIAVIGASETPTKVGHTALRNLIVNGFAGEIYPINPRQPSVQSRLAFRHVCDVPHTIDLAIICTPAATVAGLIRECGEAGILGLIILTAGFREIGPAGKALEQELQIEQRRFPGMRIIGPNCLGVLSPGAKLNASFANGMPKPGNVAFLSQSGALCTSVLDWALQKDLGFSQFVSLGNMLDVGMGDLLDYFALDALTESAILYAESIQDAREFMSAARAFTREKPIVAFKSGRFAESAQAAASHTGAIAGVDAVYEAAFQRAGIVRVFEISEMFECAELLARRKNSDGRRLAIVTNAGGPGVMATDALIERRGELAQLAPDTLARLDEILPESWSHRNPVDVLGDAMPGRYARTVEIVLQDERVDALLAILSPVAMTDPTAIAAAIANSAATSPKSVLAAWIGGAQMQRGRAILNAAKVPNFATPEEAVRAFMSLVAYARNRDYLYETPREFPLSIPIERRTGREPWQALMASAEKITLSEIDSKALLASYGIPTTLPQLVLDERAAVELARRLGHPVVMKIHSPDISHKTDVGGVVLNLNTDAEVIAAYQAMMKSAREKRSDARIEGVTLQPQVITVNPVELILGAKQDPVFGTVVLVGMGGIATELFQDRALELPPLTERLARRMLTSLRTWPLLAGFRGRAACNVDRLIEIMIRFSYLLADYPEIVECDVNPLLVTPHEVTALDARMIVQAKPQDGLRRPYSHLAIRPYPDEFTFHETLSDGTPVLLRPIKPEDEPEWRAMLETSSRETIWSRFHYLFREPTHNMATRFCFIDYDREMALAAEIEEDGRRRMIGIGRLVADPDHKSAEYAAFVTDRWQHKGLGRLLTNRSLQVAKKWGLSRIVGETTFNNTAMLATFRRAGFTLDYHAVPDAVLANLNLP